MLTFGTVPDEPWYRAPMALRLIPLLPSQPSSQSAVTSKVSPCGSSRTALARSRPSVIDNARQPINSRTVGSSSAASRSTDSTTDWGAC